MNHIFKIVWSVANNAWVVTSELGKSRGKKSSRIKRASALGMILALVGMGTSYAQASCDFDANNALNGNNGTCESAIEKLVGAPTKLTIEDVTVKPKSGTPAGGAIGITSNTDGASIDLVVKDVVVDNSYGQTSGVWLESNAANSDVSVKFVGNNTIKMGGATDTAVLLKNNSNNPTSAIIEIEGILNIQHYETTSFVGAADGLEVRGQGGTDKKMAAIYHHGAGDIRVGDGNGVFSEIIGQNGDAKIEINDSWDSDKAIDSSNVVNIITKSTQYPTETMHNAANGIFMRAGIDNGDAIVASTANI